jgi:hypothetical protein
LKNSEHLFQPSKYRFEHYRQIRKYSRKFKGEAVDKAFSAIFVFGNPVSCGRQNLRIGVELLLQWIGTGMISRAYSGKQDAKAKWCWNTIFS